MELGFEASRPVAGFGPARDTDGRPIKIDGQERKAANGPASGPGGAPLSQPRPRLRPGARVGVRAGRQVPWQERCWAEKADEFRPLG